MARMAKQGGKMTSMANNPYFSNVESDQRMNFNIPAVPASNEYAYWWARRELAGDEDMKNINAKMNKDVHLKWIAVKPGEIPELDHLARGGLIVHGDLMLMKATKEMARNKQEWKIWKAKNQIKELKQDTLDRFKDRTGKRLGMVEDRIQEEPEFE